MKRLYKTLLAVFAAAAALIIAAVPVHALSDSLFDSACFIEQTGCYTLITDIQGETHSFVGVIDAGQSKAAAAPDTSRHMRYF